MIARRAALLLWVALIVGCVVLAMRLHIDTDMSAFLPRSASPEERVLLDQFRSGVVSRLLLVAIENVPPAQTASISRHMVRTLGGDADLAAVENGEDSGFERDRAFLWSHRYVLSDQVAPERFTAAGLRAALHQDLADLGSTGGFLIERMLPEDPSREMLYLIAQQQRIGGPDRPQGVWMSPDGRRSLLMVLLGSGGSDIDAAQRALGAIHAAFAEATAGSDTAGARLLVTGAPLFAVESRDRIKSDATRLSIAASVLVAAILIAAYRSPLVLVLSFVPVVSGALAGIAAVGLAFRAVHGITLGFGATLIGEAVDYAVYLFTQTAADSGVDRTIRRIWPTLRLGVLTSIVGFAAMLFSSFEGFAQLGLFTISGLAVAVCVTRWVLPSLMPAGFAGVRQSRTMLRLATMVTGARRLRPVLVILVLGAGLSLVLDQGSFWNRDLASLSPLSPGEQRLDQALRQDMRLPDAGLLVAIRGGGQEAVLQAVERISGSLATITRQGALGGYETPTRYLPSLATQRTRQAALPDAADLQANLDVALQDLPFQPGLFAPFVAAIAQAKASPPVTRTDLDGTSLALQVDSQLLADGPGWLALLPLRGVTDRAAVARAIGAEPSAALVDLKAAQDRLLGVYLREGITLAALGTGAIGLLLAVNLRSTRRLAAVAAPLAAAVLVTLAILRLGGQSLTIFNLFGLLLVIAIGSNYCLFFDRVRHDPAGFPQVWASLLLANACTVAGFGVLSVSQTPVLHGLGMPVAIGTFLSLVFASVIMAPEQTTTNAVSR